MNRIEPEILSRMERLRIAPEFSGDSIEPPPGGRRRAVFVDRDGVIIENGYPGPFENPPIMIEGAPEALRGFRELGYIPVVVTNQGAIGMGSISHRDMVDVMESISENIGHIPWERAYYSPYHPDALIEDYRVDSMDRKPGPGMLWRAASELDLDLESSFMIGDHLTDIIAGNRAGCGTILVVTGGGKESLKEILCSEHGEGHMIPDMVAADLYHAYLALKEEFASRE